MRSEKGFYLIRLVVAGYLAYLGIKLISDMVKGAESENPVLFIFFGIGFIVIAVFLGIWTVKGLMRVSQQEREAREAEEAEAAKEAEEAKAAAGGVAMIEAAEEAKETVEAAAEEATEKVPEETKE